MRPRIVGVKLRMVTAPVRQRVSSFSCRGCCSRALCEMRPLSHYAPECPAGEAEGFSGSTCRLNTSSTTRTSLKDASSPDAACARLFRKALSTRARHYSCRAKILQANPRRRAAMSQITPLALYGDMQSVAIVSMNCRASARFPK